MTLRPYMVRAVKHPDTEGWTKARFVMARGPKAAATEMGPRLVDQRELYLEVEVRTLVSGDPPDDCTHRQAGYGLGFTKVVTRVRKL